MIDIRQFQGELAALSAAFFWAASSFLYALIGQHIPPLLLNLVKGTVAIALILFTLALIPQTAPQITIIGLSGLFFSGVFGIALGDTAYFTALTHLGARKTLLLETFAPPLAALLAFVFLDESLGVKTWFGIIVTGLGVAWVITERTSHTVVNHAHPWRGIIWGILAATAQASGAVLSRFAFLESEITPLWSSLIRLSAGNLILLVLLGIRQPVKTTPIVWTPKLLGVIGLAAFAGTYLGIWLQQTALKLAPTGIAQILTSTSPLFILPIVASRGEKLSFRAILGVLIALFGIGILFT